MLFSLGEHFCGSVITHYNTFIHTGCKVPWGPAGPAPPLSLRDISPVDGGINPSGVLGMRLLRQPDRHFQIAGGTHKPTMPVRTQKPSLLKSKFFYVRWQREIPNILPAFPCKSLRTFPWGRGMLRGKRTCGFGDGVSFLKPQQQKSYAPFAPHPPRPSGQEGRIGRLIFLFLKI